MRQKDEIVWLRRRFCPKPAITHCWPHPHTQSVSEFTWRPNGGLGSLMNKRHDGALGSRSADYYSNPDDYIPSADDDG